MFNGDEALYGLREELDFLIERLDHLLREDCDAY